MIRPPQSPNMKPIENLRQILDVGDYQYAAVENCIDWETRQIDAACVDGHLN